MRATKRAELAANWRALVAAVVGCGVGVTGLPFYSLSSFVILLEAERGWSRGAVGGALLAETVGFLIAGPIAGRLTTRFGARRVILASIPLFAAAMALPAWLATSVPMLWACYLFIGVVGIGTSPVTYTRVVTARFDRARGLALGTTLAGTGLAALMLPLIVPRVALTWGSAGAFVALGLLALAAWPLAWAWIPRDEAQATASGARAAPLSAAERRRFVLIGLAFFLASLALAGSVVHLAAMMRDAGVAAASAAAIASAVGLGVIAARLIMGAALDVFSARIVAAAAFTAAALGSMALALGTPPLAAAGAVLIGTAIGAEVDLIAYLVSRYFPNWRYARVYGWQFGFFAIGAGLSPVLLNALRSPEGGYLPALSFCAASLLAAAGLLIALGRAPVSTADRPSGDNDRAQI